MADPDFPRKIMPLVDRLFPAEEIRVETFRPEGAEPFGFLPDVRVTHLPTGEVAVSDQHGTQMENRIAALLELRARLDGR